MNEKRLELALEAAGLGQFEWDEVRQVLSISPSAAALVGVPAGDVPTKGGWTWDQLIHGDDMARVTALRDPLVRGERFQVDVRTVRPDDGRTVWLRISGAPELGPDGTLIYITGLMSDITAFKLEEEQRVTLMAELDHRVKNMLAAVQVLAYQTAKRTTSLDAFLQNFSGRLKALGSANELLTAARWRGAAVDHVAAAELGALAPGQTSWDGPELFLTPRATNALSLALHELATNAVKFGALAVESGHVDLRWKRLGNGGFELIWSESGGPTVVQPVRRGFGTTLLEQVTGRELNGEAVVEYRPSGVRARLTAGAAAVAPRPESVPDVTTARVVETVAAARAPRSLKGSRVLIVEDAVLLALELETGLADAGAEIVGPAYELEEAMALLDRPIDAAVLDANLNGRSVMPVAEALFARGVPFVFATGYGDNGGAPGGFEAPVIRKPYDVTQVAAAVADLLAAR
ncbi:PAS domain S-box protein [Phenylobacterium sp. LjRoot225]|uniref:HWE histidine kinase domain-containing protein n=1 Tax=Phenylobacterium sp. LjRoot225 TaxID=3342285 RepID=UPI003ECDDA1A